jgi:hypothetical protein
MISKNHNPSTPPSQTKIGASELDKSLIDRLLKEKGEVRGEVFLTDGRYVLEKEGEEGLKKLEKRVKELGLPIDYRNARALDWYPIGLRVISLLLIKDTFNWSDKEIWEMGYAAPKTSFIVKMVMKYFVSVKKLAEKAPEYWAQHYTRGKLELTKFDEKERKLILTQTDTEIHPILYTYLEGYYNRIFHFVAKNAEIRAKEAICEGKPCHIWEGKW